MEAVMNILAFLKDLLLNTVATSVATYLGIILAIYYAYKVHHKKIKYCVARNGDKYILAFWNASGRTIFCEDIYYFYAFGNVDCKCEVVYSSNIGVPLDISLGEEEIAYNKHIRRRYNRYARKINISFDFLNKRKGYVIHVENKQKANCESTKFIVQGRIRGESMKSIQSYSKGVHESGNRKAIKLLLLESVTSLFNVIIALTPAVSSIIQKAGMEGKDSLQRIMLAVTITIIILVLMCYHIYTNSMPSALKREFQKYIKVHNYEIFR